MKGIDTKGIYRRAFRGVAWMGEAALFCFGLVAMLVLVVLMTVLTAVMLAATVLPAPAVRQRRELRGRGDSMNIPEMSAPRTTNQLAEGVHGG